MKEDFKRFNHPKMYGIYKKKLIDTYHMFVFKHIEYPIFTVYYLQSTG